MNILNNVAGKHRWLVSLTTGVVIVDWLRNNAVYAQHRDGTGAAGWVV